MGLETLGFYVTVGRGTEKFAEYEIRNRFSEQQAVSLASTNVNVQVRDGKIMFNVPGGSDDYLEKILNLKSVERAFVAITDYENTAKVEVYHNILLIKGNGFFTAWYLISRKRRMAYLFYGKRNFLDQLMQTMSNSHSFETAIKVLSQRSSLPRKRKVDNAESHLTRDVSEPPKKKTRLHDTVKVNCSELQSQPEPHSNSCDEVEDIRLGDDGMDDEATSYKTFRMSIKCSGKSARWINVKKLSKDLSWRISRASNWTVDLRNSNFEICLHISDGHVTAGIPLTRKPLSRRPFISDPGLRGPIAWIMVHLADIEPNDVILDPMCGKGTLLLEAYSNMKDASYMGVDCDLSQIEMARQNVSSIGYQKHIDLFQADGLCLPLKPSSIDKVLCDAPFNQKHFTSKRPDEFYISFLKEMSRVLCVGGRFVLLTSQELSKTIIPLLQPPEDKALPQTSEKEPLASRLDSGSSCIADDNNKFSFELLSNHYVKLGETHGEIIVMIKL